MASQISRKYDFKPGTRIYSSQVDEELDQLVSSYNILNDEVDTHVVNVLNPHAVTKAQVGLGNVDNTADAVKPVSTPQQAALNLKADVTSVIAKTNTTAFTPTADYHPATKKYVDETAAGVVLGQIPDGSITTQKLADHSVTADKLSGVTPTDIGAYTKYETDMKFQYSSERQYKSTFELMITGRFTRA